MSTTASTTSSPMEDLTQYHQKIQARYASTSVEMSKLNKDIGKLIPFNGYYSLEKGSGSFFTIDTNMVVLEKNNAKPIFDLSFIISLDGEKSERAPFTGTFDGENLKQIRTNDDQFSMDLKFTRQDNTKGIMASLSGTIAFPNQSPVSITGTTYNNPIDYTIYAGEYYVVTPTEIVTEETFIKKETKAISVLRIKENYNLLFDFDKNNGLLEPVTNYCYNLNMYYFSFVKGDQTYKLIMGTGAGKGLVSNNISINKEKTNSRSLVTIPFPSKTPSKTPNLNSYELAKFSGYYTIPSIAPGAFICIQAAYVDLLDITDVYTITIGLSMDGKTSKEFYFNDKNMSFDNDILSISSEGINIQFNREYTPSNRALVSIMGTINGHTVSGYTPFNPVPLSAFSGVTMINKQHVSLTVINDNEIIYNGKSIKNITYVPIMYILATEEKNETLVLSFGTDGCKGNTCIITNIVAGEATMSVVYAIDNKKPTNNQNVATAIQEHLIHVKNKVAKINDINGKPIQIPNYDTLYNAATELDTVENPTQHINIIQSLLGSANNIGSETISFTNKGKDPEYSLKFPKDHSIHGTMGSEWYWLACHLNVLDEHGKKAKLSVLDTMQKNRSVGTDVQAKYNWTDEEVAVTCNIATVTVKMEDNDETSYYRRNTNEQWPLKGGKSSFSKEGEPFSFEVGKDSLKGSLDVLPLQLVVDDPGNMKIDITLTNAYFLNTETSFFKQGMPTKNGGTGITPLPTPGIYYSWPQLEVTGTITVGGKKYTVVSGNGWIDHQLMSPSILNNDGKPNPKLFEKTSTNSPLNGWIWQYFNLENNTSFTGSGFILGEIPANNIVTMDYGYFLQPNTEEKAWDATFIMGDIELEKYKNFPSICSNPKSTPVSLPINRDYKSLYGLDGSFSEKLALLLHPIKGQAIPWFNNGTFNNPDGGFCAEFPADFISGNPSHHPNGVGYLESVGFEEIDQYEKYALAILKGNNNKTK